MADSTLRMSGEDTDAEHVSDQAIQGIEAALQAAPSSNSVTDMVNGCISYGKANRKRLCKFVAGGVVTTIMWVVAAEFIIWYKKRS